MEKSFFMIALCGLVLTGLSAFASESDVRFDGGHPWLSKSELVSPQPKSGREILKKAKDEVVGTDRVFDIVVSMYQKKDNGKERMRTDVEKGQVGMVLTNFAKAVYEASEGKHFIRNVKIYEGCYLGADILWNEKGHPEAGCATIITASNPESGAIISRQKLFHGTIRMFDYDKSDRFLLHPFLGGWILGHEWGHACYGFGEEYWKKKGDIPVKKSMMGETPWELAYDSKAGELFALLCNLSRAKDYKSERKGEEKDWWRDTGETDQFRTYNMSCFKWMSELFPDFPDPKSADKSAPEINLNTEKAHRNSVKYLHIDWPSEQPLMWGICLDHSGSMEENDLAKAKANAKLYIDTAPAGTIIAVYVFDDKVTPLIPYTKVTDANRVALKDKIDSIKSGNMTALWKAADTALNDMNSLDPNHKSIGSLLLLTDGKDNSSGSITRQSVVSKCQSMGVAFNSISYGVNADPDLGAASSATGGRNVSASGSLSSLNDAFSRLLTYGSSRGTIADEKGATSSSKTLTKTFVVDSSVADFQATVTLSVPSASATVYFISPSGNKTKVESAADVGSESTFLFVKSRPIAGTWKVFVEAPSGTKVSCYLDASAGKEPPRLSVRSDGNLLVYAHLTYGAPVDGAKIKAVFNDNGQTREVPFEPIGGGTYRLDLADCGKVGDGFTVRADAVMGVATYTYVGVFDHEGGGEGSPIPESFTRSEWFSLGKGNETSFFALGKGMLEFQWRTSGSGCPSAIQFLHNERAVDSLPSGQGWRKEEFVFDEEGSHVFKWRTTEDSGQLGGSWLENVVWHPEPDVRMSSLVATPRWPWNGLVDIDFSFVPTIAGTKATFSVSGVDGDLGKTISAKTLSGAYRNLGEGTHRVTWNLGADAPAFHSSAFTVVLDAKVEPFARPSVKVSSFTAANGVKLEWPSVSPCATYTVFRASNASGTDAAVIGTVSASKNSRAYWDSAAPYGQTVWYAVKASAWHLDGVRSAFVRARRPMNCPSTLTATEGSRTDGVLVSWTPSTGATRSRIFRQVRDGISSGAVLTGQSWGAKIAETTGSSWLDTTAVPGVDYIYAVSCVSSEGEASALPTVPYRPVTIGTGEIVHPVVPASSYSGYYPAFGWRGIGAPVIISATRKDDRIFVKSASSKESPSSIVDSNRMHLAKAWVDKGWNLFTTYKLSWKPVEGAMSYRIEYWDLNGINEILYRDTTTDCSYETVRQLSVQYSIGEGFRITPVGVKHDGKTTEVKITE